jgi:hypothetical protein
MGCHTWFYEKIDSPVDIREFVLLKINENLDFFNKLIHRRDLIDQELLDAYPEWTEDYGLEQTEIWKNLLGYLNGEEELPVEFANEIKIVEDIWEELYLMFHTDLIVYENGNWYKSSDSFHDIFRKYGYPDDKLFSLEETMDYINDSTNNCNTSENTEKWLKEFWDKHPDGMINFG